MKRAIMDTYLDDFFGAGRVCDVEDLKGPPEDVAKKRMRFLKADAAAEIPSGITVRRCEVISCSRRTDIPAFFMPWVLSRLQSGVVAVTNPRNAAQVSYVSLSPRDVRCIAWWSKDYGPFLSAWLDPISGPILKRYDAHYFNFTLNAPSAMEPRLRVSFAERLQQLQQLARIFGGNNIVLRFDPIVRWCRTTGPLQAEDNLQNFDQLCAVAGSCGVPSIAIAFVIPYRAVTERTRRCGYELIEFSSTERRDILRRLAQIAKQFGVKVAVCSQPEVLTEGKGEGVIPSTCIDGDRINAALASRHLSLLKNKTKDQGQRVQCRCVRSIDIGSYSDEFACPHSCIYCYANPTKNS